MAKAHGEGAWRRRMAKAHGEGASCCYPPAGGRGEVRAAGTRVPGAWQTLISRPECATTGSSTRADDTNAALEVAAGGGSGVRHHPISGRRFPPRTAPPRPAVKDSRISARLGSRVARWRISPHTGVWRDPPSRPAPVVRPPAPHPKRVRGTRALLAVIRRSLAANAGEPAGGCLDGFC